MMTMDDTRRASAYETYTEYGGFGNGNTARNSIYQQQQQQGSGYSVGHSQHRLSRGEGLGQGQGQGVGYLSAGY